MLLEVTHGLFGLFQRNLQETFRIYKNVDIFVFLKPNVGQTDKD